MVSREHHLPAHDVLVKDFGITAKTKGNLLSKLTETRKEAMRNDCVYCINDDSNFCKYFNQKTILPNAGKGFNADRGPDAVRYQEECSGFELDPATKKYWREKYGD